MTIRQRKTTVEVLPSQQRFLASRAFTKGFSGPVGSGKTYALCYEALQCTARNPGRVGLIGAPTYPMLRDVTLTTMLEILEEKRIPYSYLKQENVLTLERSKSKILFRSLERFDLLLNATGSIRTCVHPGCKELITDFYQVSWKPGDRFELDKATDKKRTHLSDAFGYLVSPVAPINAFQRQNLYN